MQITVYSLHKSTHYNFCTLPAVTCVHLTNGNMYKRLILLSCNYDGLWLHVVVALKVLYLSVDALFNVHFDPFQNFISAETP